MDIILIRDLVRFISDRFIIGFWQLGRGFLLFHRNLGSRRGVRFDRCIKRL